MGPDQQPKDMWSALVTADNMKRQRYCWAASRHNHVIWRHSGRGSFVVYSAMTRFMDEVRRAAFYGPNRASRVSAEWFVAGPSCNGSFRQNRPFES